MSEEAKAKVESGVLHFLSTGQSIPDSLEYAQSNSIEHQLLVGVIKSLSSNEVIDLKQLDPRKSWELSSEAEQFVINGSPEAQVMKLATKEGVPQKEIETKLGALAKIGFSQLVKPGYIKMEKGADGVKIVKLKDEFVDTVVEQLKLVKASPTGELSTVDYKNLKGRKLISEVIQKPFAITKGAKFTTEVKKPEADLTPALLANDNWKNCTFKSYNLNALGKPTSGGYLHPLMKVKAQIRDILLEMGFEEMPTNNYVESSFWNFDALFQPQQHPARDAHDTFFINEPASTRVLPEEYAERVKQTHQTGGYGSIGWRYDWKMEEARKNIMRTHTTAVSSRMLYKLAQDGFKPKKYFSIDRVFRNESLDATHLAEFHQVEGLICDKGIHLGHLMGVIKSFYEKFGIKQIRFKSAYNPYTEPSMEIFGFNEKLNRWVEIGNSGIFRPEMLLPMGLPDDVRVIAWGLGLERPTMILYGLDDIRKLFGHGVDLRYISNNPICRLGQP